MLKHNSVTFIAQRIPKYNHSFTFITQGKPHIEQNAFCTISLPGKRNLDIVIGKQLNRIDNQECNGFSIASIDKYKLDLHSYLKFVGKFSGINSNQASYLIQLIFYYATNLILLILEFYLK